MITAVAARWLLTVVFAAAGLGAMLPRTGPAGTARPADRISAALFGCAALGFWLIGRADYGRVRRPSLPALLHTLMASTMIWMLTAMPAVSEMTTAGSAHGAMAPTFRAAEVVPVRDAEMTIPGQVPWRR